MNDSALALLANRGPAASLQKVMLLGISADDYWYLLFLLLFLYAAFRAVQVIKFFRKRKSTDKDEQRP